MGSPAQIDALTYVFGTTQLDFHELAPKEKVAIFNGVITAWRKHFKYFPAFEPARELLKREDWKTLVSAHVPLPIEGLEGFNARTQCTHLITIKWDWEVRGRVAIERLILTRDSKLVLWKTQYEHSDEGDSVRSIYTAVVSEFEKFTKQQLGQLLANRSLTWHLFRRLQEIANKAVVERELRLAAIRRDVDLVKAVLKRLDLDDKG